ncbi:hypothetical protein H4S14_001798 [Agrobacterium vitis]|nr:hypothetical protein [Agrobacterium vitis]MBE1438053.1 hypothetical protein [Agrobacterium vitis]
MQYQHLIRILSLPFICRICYTITRNVITYMERHAVQDRDIPIPSLLAHSALTRVGVAVVLIAVIWLGIQWAVALQ